MKTRIYRPIFCLIFVGILSWVMAGCSDDFFNEKAGDRITPDKHYKTINDAFVSMQGAIAPLQDVLPKLIMVDGLRSDMMEVTPYADIFLKEINLHTYNAGNPYLDPSVYYKVIININEVLANIAKVNERDKEFDEFFLKYTKGSLIGMRAWVYLTLSRYYGQVSYIESNMTEVPANLNQSVMSKDVLLDTLINQLLPLIHTDKQLAELRVGHFVNTKALLGELYLEKNDYTNAVTYLKLACESFSDNSVIFKVDPTYKEAAWQNIFLNAESQGIETISVIPYSLTEGQYNPLANWMGYNELYYVKPSQVLVDSFMVQKPGILPGPGDVWRGLGVSFGIDTTSKLNDSVFTTSAFITKYAIDKNEPASSDIIISRASDIHLLLAEALNRKGDDLSQKIAMILINRGINGETVKPVGYSKWTSNQGIRGRVSLKARVLDPTLTGEDKTRAIEDMIMAERALELAFEGKRWFDLMRVANRRAEPQFLASKVAAKFEGTADYDYIYNKLMNPENWYLPLGN